MKHCTACGTVTSGPGSRCPKHAQGSRRTNPNPVYRSPAWRRLSASVIRAHVGEQGWVCPGDGPDHPPHPSRALTLDHIVPLVEGGPPFGRANLRVLCRGTTVAGLPDYPGSTDEPQLKER